MQNDIQISAQPVQFTGTGPAYFRIWIVNVFLMLLTLGIYSAWAKVRSKRYFYGNTRIDESGFQYLAEPVDILKGRAIAVLILLVYITLTYYWPLADFLFSLLFLVAIPWLAYKSLQFNHRNSAYRNISFQFTGALGEAVQVYIAWPLLGVLTFGILWPVAVHRRKQYVFNNTSFGGQRVESGVTGAQFYPPYLLALLVFLAILFLGLAVLGSGLENLGALFSVDINEDEDVYRLNLPVLLNGVFLFSIIAPVFLAVVAARAIITAGINNRIWNNLALDGHRFTSNLNPLALVWIYLSNTLLVVCTLGLASPWAMVRLARYRATHLTMQVTGDLDGFVGALTTSRKATGQEVGDVLDAGVDFGF